jgi:NAD(P)-dependent dehydrogenase (short-subunit alcohol dehydrogenase family)
MYPMEPGSLDPWNAREGFAMAVVLITGCSSGLGLATALEFARRGDRVFASMRNVAKAGSLREAAQARGLAVDVLEIDVTDDASVQRGVAGVLTSEGQIDVLVNNAGVSNYGTVELMQWDWLREMMETNFFGSVRMIRAVLPAMRARRSGSILNVSSVTGRIPGTPCASIYAASKHALGALSESLAVEVEGFDIKVALIEPGFLKTDLVENGKVTLDPHSPYAVLESAEYAFEQASAARAGDPILVAARIVEAATAGGPLHVVVGNDADTFIGLAATMTFEQWAAMIKTELGL